MLVHLVNYKKNMCIAALLMPHSLVVSGGRAAWWLETLARKQKIHGLGPAASYVQR